MKVVRQIADFASKIIRSIHTTKKTVQLKYKKPDVWPTHNRANFINQTPWRPSSLGRIVLVDGTNVAMSRNRSSAHFSVSGLEICLDKLSSTNETWAIVPQFRLKQAYSSDNRRLQQLEKQKKVMITPGKTLNNNILTCNPKPILLDIAKEFGAAIVSNDQFEEERRIDSGIITSSFTVYQIVLNPQFRL